MMIGTFDESNIKTTVLGINYLRNIDVLSSSYLKI
jgi:hypothetical protein